MRLKSMFAKESTPGWIESSVERGGFEFAGFEIQQSPGALLLFPEILQGTFPTGFVSVVEIGTGAGGLTCALRCLLPHRFGIETFDSSPVPRRAKEFCSLMGNCFFYGMDVFHDPILVKRAMQCRAHCVLICDTEKERRKEVETFAPFLRPGDLLFLHEYVESDEQQSMWKTVHGTGTELRPILEKMGLQDWYSDVAEIGGYGCFRRKQ
jgi:hypothetical protein